MSDHQLMRAQRRRRCRHCYRIGVRRDVSTVCSGCPAQQGGGMPYCRAHFGLIHNLPVPYYVQGTDDSGSVTAESDPGFSPVDTVTPTRPDEHLMESAPQCDLQNTPASSITRTDGNSAAESSTTTCTIQSVSLLKNRDNTSGSIVKTYSDYNSLPNSSQKLHSTPISKPLDFSSYGMLQKYEPQESQAREGDYSTDIIDLSCDDRRRKNNS